MSSDQFEDLIEILGLAFAAPRRRTQSGDAARNQAHLAARETAAAADTSSVLAQADQILDEAQRQAEAVLAEAARQAEEMREIGRKEGQSAGYEAGLAEGRAKARAEAEQLLHSAREEAAALRAEAEAVLAQARQEAEKARQQVVEEAAMDIVNLAVAVAERLVRAHLAMDPEVVVRVAKEALMAMGMSERAVLRVNPLDLAAVQGSMDALKTVAPQVHEIVVEDDPSVPEGSAVVSGQGGVADGRWSVQLDNMRSALERAARGEG